MILFSGSAGSSSKLKREEKKERKNERDEKYEVQELVFTRWANAIVEEASQNQQQSTSFTIQELKDISEIKFLSLFSTHITGSYQALSLSGNQCNDIDVIIHSLVDYVNYEDDKIFQININEFIDGGQRALLSICWHLIQIYWKRFAPKNVCDKNLTEVIRDWCLEATSNHEEIRLIDFKSSWRDGIVLNIVLHFQNNSLIDLEEVHKMRREDRIDQVLNIARKHYKVPKIIYPKEFSSSFLDTKSMVCYLMMLYLRTNSNNHHIYSSSSASSSKDPVDTPPLAHKNSNQFSVNNFLIQYNQLNNLPNETEKNQSKPLPLTSKKQSIVVAPFPSQQQSQQNSPQSVTLLQNAPITPLAVSDTNVVEIVQQQQQQLQQQKLQQQIQQQQLQLQQQQHEQLQVKQKLDQQQHLLQKQNLQIKQQQQYQIEQELQLKLKNQLLEEHQKQIHQLAQSKENESILLDKSNDLKSDNDNLLQNPSSSTAIVTGIVNQDNEKNINNENQPNNETASRKSSTSSRKSSKNCKKYTQTNEEAIKEFELCLEQVLGWLLEAAEELKYMNKFTQNSNQKMTNQTELDIIKKKFCEHEQFMKSLTESQNSVGRVLHRGQQLAQKQSDNKIATGILNQLRFVNDYWEDLREAAMKRQQNLHNQLNLVQRKHLKEISDWLTEIEKLIQKNEFERLADDVDTCNQQITEHSHIQDQIDNQQPNIHLLSSFIAIVNEKKECENSNENIEELETLLQSVSKRWSNICEWAEQRARHLDGLPELIINYNTSFEHLSEWLTQRQNDLMQLENIENLETENNFIERINILHKIELALETEHSSFVKLSQFCSELVQRFEQGKNLIMANKIRKRLDKITEIWDNIVFRLEEHSQMLVNNEKAKFSNVDTSSMGITADSTSFNNINDEQTEFESKIKKQHKIIDLEKIETEQMIIITEFIERVKLLEQNIESLYDWATNFNISTRREDIRNMIQICQRKLKEIKDVEPMVTKLQIELEKIHQGRNFKFSFSSNQLNTINNVFECFMQKWSKIVSKISDSLNKLSNPSSSSDESDVDMIIIRITEWLKSANSILHSILHNDNSEIVEQNKKQQKNSLETIFNQLNEHQRHIKYIKRRFNKTKTNSINIDNQKNIHQNKILLLEQDLNKLEEKIKKIMHNEQTNNNDKIINTEESSEKLKTKNLFINPITNELEEQQPSSYDILIKKKNYQSSDILKFETTSLCDQLNLESHLTSQQECFLETKELDKWITEHESELKEGEVRPGNVDELKLQLQNCDALIAEVREKLKTTDEVNTQALDKFLRSAQTKRNNIVDSINKTQLAIHKFVKAEECADRHKIILDRLKINQKEMNVQQYENELKNLYNELTVVNLSLKTEAIDMLDEIALSNSSLTQTTTENQKNIVRDMKNRIIQLENQWNTLSNEILDLLSNAKNNRYLHAENLLGNQISLVSELQDAVKASAEATDAEELSEHLDNLEHLLDRFNSNENEGVKNNDWSLLKQIAQNKIEDKDQTASTMTNLSTAWSNYCNTSNVVVPAARKRCENLRLAITNCEHFEHELCKFQTWCTHMNHLLSVRNTSEIHGLEIPIDYKNAFDAGTLLNQIDNEFIDYELLIQKLNIFIETNKSQWSSNDRLRLQSEHAQSQIAELKIKYNEFKQPLILNNQIKSVEQQLNEIELAIDDLTGINAENCEYCLAHCQQICKQLGVDDLAGKAAELEALKEKIIRESILSETNVIEIGLKINEIQQKCAQLEQRAIFTCEKLERCITLIKNLEDENINIEKVILSAEKNIDDIVAINSSSNENKAQSFSHHSSQEIIKKLNLLKKQFRIASNNLNKAYELKTFLRQNSIRLSSDVIEKININEKRVLNMKRQLAFWAESIQTSDENDEEACANFELLANHAQNKIIENIEELNKESDQSNNDCHSNKIEENALLYERLEYKGAQLKSRFYLLKNSELAKKKIDEITQKLIEINALSQIYAKKCAIKLANSALKNDNQNLQKNNKLIEFKNLENLTRKQSNSSLTATANDASSLSSNYGSENEIKNNNNSENELNLLKALKNCQNDYKIVLSYLNFKQYPIKSLDDWENRLKHINDWIKNNRINSNKLDETDKTIINNTNNTLEQHENNLEILNMMEKNLIDSTALLDLIKAKRQVIIDNIKYSNEKIEELLKENLSQNYFNVPDLLKIQSKQMQICNDLQNIKIELNNLYKLLPLNNDLIIKDTNYDLFLTENNSLITLNLQLSKIEDEIENALNRVLCNKKKQNLIQTADCVSLSSGAGLSLAMDVNETESEENNIKQENYQEFNNQNEILNKNHLSQQKEEKSLEQFYSNLNAIEEYFEKPEHLTYEGIEEKLNLLNEFLKELNNGEIIINKHQMTIGFNELKHVKQRIQTAYKMIDERCKTMCERQDTLKALNTQLNELEERIVLLGVKLHNILQNCTIQNEINNKKQKTNKSSQTTDNTILDIDELEALQLNLEEELPSIAVQLLQCTNRFNAINEKLSSGTNEEFSKRIEQANIDFNEHLTKIRKRRKHLEERLTNQTHLNSQLETLEFWCDETEAGIVNSDIKISILSPQTQLEAMLKNILARYNELPEKIKAHQNLENLKNRFVALANVEPNIKHDIRRKVAHIGKRISDLKVKISTKLEELQTFNTLSNKFWDNFKQFESWLINASAQIDIVKNAKIYRPSLVNIENLKTEIPKYESLIELMHSEIKATKSFKNQDNYFENNDSISKKEHKNEQKFMNLLKEFSVVKEEIKKILQKSGNDFDFSNEQVKNVNTENDNKQETNTIINDEKINECYLNGAESTEYGSLSLKQLSNNDTNTSEQYESDVAIKFDKNMQQSSNERLSQRRPRRISVDEQARLDTVTRFGSWLEELQREVAFSVDLSDQHIIRQAMNKAQNWIDELRVNKIEVLRVISEGHDRLVLERAQSCNQKMDKVLELCERRRNELQTILEECRAWEQLRLSIEIWIDEVEEKLKLGLQVKDLNDLALADELKIVACLLKDATQVWRERLARFNSKTNALLDVYRYDDGHNLSHLTSKLNTQWTKLNDALCIRRAVLEATQRSRNDFHSALNQVQIWLTKISNEVIKLEKDSNNLQLLKDTSKRRDWLAQEKEIRVEIEAHTDVIESVKQMGKKILDEKQETDEESERLKNNLQAIELNWQQLLSMINIIKERLKNAQEECESLTQNLANFLHWTNQQLKIITNAQPVGGDLGLVQAQFEVIKTIEKNIEERERQVKDCIQLANSYLMQHNLRQPIYKPSIFDASKINAVEDNSTILKTQQEERRIGVQIYADSEKLKAQWDLLKQQCANWLSVVSKTHSDMQELNATIAEALLEFGTIEDNFNQLPAVETLRLDQLKNAKTENFKIKKHLHKASICLDDVNDCAGQIVAKNIALSTQLDAQIHTINQRFEKLKNDIICRETALERAFNDFGPSSEHFLIESVEPPWQRAVSNLNQLPYYVNHDTEVTQWDHPVMVDIIKQLSTFNQVKFSAYRTAMKLRTIQKRLCYLIELTELNDVFECHLKEYNNDYHLRIEDAVMCLVPLFENVNEHFPHLLSNVSLAVDLFLNMVLNIYDACRDGKLRLLSFKICLVVMCNASLESKYKYLFKLISTNDGVEQKALAILFYDLIHIPKFLGESAAFGGLNIEPSVRSCFEHAKFSLNICVDDFLDWLKKEPQSIVWLPVMHRLTSSETAKHQAKCNACKMFPIVGLRYRCLQCFNFDVCQNCFFSQRTAKNHKLVHPMQEYCLPTNSRDDMRDFTAMVRNKVRRSKKRIGYLPVEQVIEGAPLEQTDLTPKNPLSESMHQRMHLFAQHLETKRIELEASISDKNGISNADNDVDKNVLIGGIINKLSNETDNENTLNKQNNEIDNKENKQIQQNQYNGLTRALSLTTNIQTDIKSPLQVINEVDYAQKEEMDQLLQKLQYENFQLKKAVEEKRRALAVNFSTATKSAPNLCKSNNNFLLNSKNINDLQNSNTNLQKPSNIITLNYYEKSQTLKAHNLSKFNSSQLHHAASTFSDTFDPNLRSTSNVQLFGIPPPVPRHGTQSAGISNSKIFEFSSANSELENNLNESELAERKKIAESRSLRLHQQRLEERSKVLEEHNRQLQQQLIRLKQRLITENQKSSSTLSKLDDNAQSNKLEANKKENSSPPNSTIWNNIKNSNELNNELSVPLTGFERSKSTPRPGFVSSSEDDDPLGKHGTEIRRHRMQKLMSTVDELNKAMESLVVSVVVDPENVNNKFSSLNDEQNLRQQQLTAN